MQPFFKVENSLIFLKNSKTSQSNRLVHCQLLKLRQQFNYTRGLSIVVVTLLLGWVRNHQFPLCVVIWALALLLLSTVDQNWHAGYSFIIQVQDQFFLLTLNFRLNLIWQCFNWRFMQLQTRETRLGPRDSSISCDYAICVVRQG